MSRIAWITGGGSGIGLAVAHRLAADGWRVAISGRSQARLDEAIAAAPHPERLLAVPLDVTDAEANQAAVATIEAHWGPIDLAMLNAGDYRPMPLAEFDLDLFRQLMEVNYLGVVNGVGALLPGMTAAGRGQILVVASLSGYCGLPNAAPYGASKAALINMAESLHPALAARGVQLRVVNPGFVRSALTAKNTFEMPGLLEPDEAARYIVEALPRSDFEIAFPPTLVRRLRLLRALPYRAFFAVTRRMLGPGGH